jgi:hypothetical protein
LIIGGNLQAAARSILDIVRNLKNPLNPVNPDSKPVAINIV